MEFKINLYFNKNYYTRLVSILILYSIINGCVSNKQKFESSIKEVPDRSFWNIYIKGDTVIYESKKKFDFGLNPIKMDNGVETINFQYFFVIKNSKDINEAKKVFKRPNQKGIEIPLDKRSVLNIFDSYDFRVSGCPIDTTLIIEIEKVNDKLIKNKTIKKVPEFEGWVLYRKEHCI